MPYNAETFAYMDRTKQLMLATPRALSMQMRLTLIAIFTNARDDGSGLELNLPELSEMTGIAIERQTELVQSLRDKGYLANGGYYTLDAEDNKVKHHMERLVVEKLIGSKRREAARRGERS